MNESLSRITESELRVLDVLWDSGRAMTMPEIRGALMPPTGWDGSTIKTLLYRLCDKGIVAAERMDVYHYSPRITRQQYREYAAASLVDRLFRGSAKNLVAALIDSRQLDDADIAELRQMFLGGEPDA